MLRVLKWRIKIYLNNKFVILLFLIVPILLTLWLAEDLDKQELGSISVSIIDEDNTAISSKYVNKLKEDSKISTVELEYDESIEEVKKEKLSAVILVKDGFSDRILKGENSDLIELTYLKDNYSLAAFTDIFVQKYFSEIIKSKNINYVLKNYGDLISRDEYIKTYEKNLEKINKSDSYKFKFNLTQVDSTIDKDSENKNIILFKYIIGTAFLMIYILVLIQTLEYQNSKKSIIRKLKLSGISWIERIIGNLIGGVIPTFLVLLVQLIIIDFIINRTINLVILPYAFIFALSVNLITVLIVKIFKKSEKLYLMIPYYIIFLWIFGDMLFNLEFISFLNIERNLIPGIGIKSIITNILLGIDVYTSKVLTYEIGFIIGFSLMVGILEYKEFKNAAS